MEEPLLVSDAGAAHHRSLGFSLLSGGRVNGEASDDDNDEEVGARAQSAKRKMTGSDWRCVLSTAATLALVMFGGAIFPIPYAFNLTGIVLGLFFVVLVAALNDYTCTLLIRTSRGCHARGLKARDGTTLSFEELAKLAGGETWLTFTRAALVLLLFGTNCGGLAVIAEAAGRTVCGLGLITGDGGGSSGSGGGSTAGGIAGGGYGANASAAASADDDVTCAPFPHFLADVGLAPAHLSLDAGGILSMAVLTLTILSPMCLARDISSLNRAGAVGIVLLLTLVLFIAWNAASAGMPAVSTVPGGPSGFFWGHPTLDAVQVFPVLGYAFYLHPVLLPLLTEMTATEQKKRRRGRGRGRRRQGQGGRRGAVGGQGVVGSGAGAGAGAGGGDLAGGGGGLGLEGGGASSGHGRGEEEEDGPLLFSMRGSVGSLGGSVSSADDVFLDAEDLDDANNDAAADEYEGEDEEGEDDDEVADYDAEERFAAAGDGGVVDGHSAADHAATLLERSVHLCMAFAIVAYTAIGICGYGLFGEDTADNILLNLRSPPLDAAMTLYQCLCFPPTFHSLRYTLDSLADGADAPRPSPVTHVARVATLLVGAMAVAALLPHSELLFALTGAVGVCAVCYALPVLMHLRLPGPPRSGGGGGGGVGGGGGGGGGGGTMLRYAVPVAALSGGMCLSALGLYSTLS